MFASLSSDLHERHTLTLLRGPFLIRSLQIKTDDMYSTHFFFVDAFLQQSTAALVREPLNHIIILRCDIVMVSCNFTTPLKPLTPLEILDTPLNSLTPLEPH